VDVTFQNTLETPIHILKWNTPFDTISGGVSFIVSREGEQLPYLGALAKRRKSASSFQEVKDTLVVRVDLSSYFDFTAGGFYSIQLNMDSLEYSSSLSAVSNTHFTSVVSNELSLFVKPLIQSTPLQANETVRVGITYQSCTSSQTSTVSNAWNLFNTMVTAMNNAMTNNQQTATFTMFFGPTSGWSKVAGVVAKEKSTSGTGAVRFNCAPPDCGSPDVFAYVYPTDTTKTVYLCGAFWKSKTSGYDSQQGVIVHELSHFTAIGGTQDYAYGLTACKQLAISSPTKAIANADNYEYYGETIPK